MLLGARQPRTRTRSLGKVEVLQVNELQVDGAGHKAGVEEGLEGPFPDGEGGEVVVPLQDGGQRGEMEGTSQDAVSQAVV
jgi:hypothetical protein